ncbi:MAG: helix-turn-helix domain-containing protein [Candidatus Adiutrix sp.]|jgi:transcriptional regulator with XRE-family HTH domain|nr:helix-turn-helix domain-containing protein [Candidatus Adiutrix sp.]
MAKQSSENTNALRYFRTYLLYWIDKSGLNKTIAAKRLGVGQSQLNEILNAKRGASICQMEKISSNLGIDIVNILQLGRKLCGDHFEDHNFSPDQIEAIEAFKSCLVFGGEAAEMLARNAVALAEKKRVEAGYKNPTRLKVLPESA